MRSACGPIPMSSNSTSTSDFLRCNSASSTEDIPPADQLAGGTTFTVSPETLAAFLSVSLQVCRDSNPDGLCAEVSGKETRPAEQSLPGLIEEFSYLSWGCARLSFPFQLDNSCSR